MIEITRKIHIQRGNHGRKQVTPRRPIRDSLEEGRIPRVSRLMALAIKFDGLIRSGKIMDQSELARLAHVTQPRMTQIMALLHLAPDIQETLLNLPRTVKGKDPIHEKTLRPICAEISWERQRGMWLAAQSVSPSDGGPSRLHAREVH